MTDDESLADNPTYRAMEEMMDSPASRAMKEMMNSPASRVIDRLFAPPPRLDYSRLLEVLERERKHKRTYEEAVIRLDQQQAIQPPPEPPPPLPEPPPPRPKKCRESPRSEEWDRWRECGKTICRERENDGKRPLGKEKLAETVIERLGLHNAVRTVRQRL